jgi:thioredoxin 2
VSSAMSAEPVVVACPSCGAGNRVSPERVAENLQPVCGQCGAVLSAEGHPVAVTDDTYAREVEQSSLPVLVDLWAPWCRPCLMIAPTLEAIAREMAGRLRVAKVNVDENPGTAGRLGVQGIPTLIVVKDGREVDRIVGALPKQALLRRLEAVV